MGAPKAPQSLGSAGKALWRQVLRAVPAEMELDEREVGLLTLAARQAAAALERAIKRDGHVVQTSAGKPVVNSAVAEVRLARLAIARLLGQLDLEPADDSLPSKWGREAARRRWHPKGAASEG